jgi:hypothetical protein
MLSLLSRFRAASVEMPIRDPISKAVNSSIYSNIIQDNPSDQDKIVLMSVFFTILLYIWIVEIEKIYCFFNFF